jgi:toxin ParE1/3/4
VSQFKLSVRAKQDLKSIAVFTQSKWSSEQRNIYLTQFDQVFRLLANTPSLGKPCEEIAKNYFKYPQNSRVIFFKKVNANNILIVRILHKRMDYTSNLNG